MRNIVLKSERPTIAALRSLETSDFAGHLANNGVRNYCVTVLHTVTGHTENLPVTVARNGTSRDASDSALRQVGQGYVVALTYDMDASRVAWRNWHCDVDNAGRIVYAPPVR